LVNLGLIVTNKSENRKTEKGYWGDFIVYWLFQGGGREAPPTLARNA
jgi:hypothetical protein